MHQHRHPKIGEDRWRGALVVIAICALTLSFATRFWAPPSSIWAPHNSHSRIGRSIDRRTVEPKRQHLDRDAAQWVSPNRIVSFIQRTASEARPLSAGAPLPSRDFADGLYVRPPPSPEFLS